MNVIVDGWLLRQQGHGTARFARTLIRGLAASDWRQRLRVAVPLGDERLVPADVDVLPVGRSLIADGVIGEALWQNRLGRYMRRCRPDDALIAPAPFYSTARVRRSIVVCHDVIPLRFPRYLGRFFYRRWLFQRRLEWMRRATCVVTDSAFTRSELLDALGPPAPPAVTVPLWTSLADSPLPTAEERRRVRSTYRLPGRYWLYAGGYDYRKNVELLIAAYGLARSVEECPGLVLAGRIPSRGRAPVCDVADALRRAGLRPDDVCCPGFIADADLAAVYAEAELFIYPSRAEGFGLPPVEAMACGCPAIVADGSSLPEVVGDEGYRFDPADSAALAEILRQAARKPMMLNPGFNRRQYGSDRGIHDYLQVILQVASTVMLGSRP